jgi:hypothetical protein
MLGFSLKIMSKGPNLTVLAWSLQTYVLVKHFYAKKGSAEDKYQVDYKTKIGFLRGFVLESICSSSSS